MSKQSAREDIHRQLDPHYFSDYAIFTGAFRSYVVRTLEEAFRRNPGPKDYQQRLLIVALYREEYAAYEDLGAFLNSLLCWTKKKLTYPLERILSYSPDRVTLERILAENKIESAEDLHAALALDEWIPAQWESIHPQIDCKKVLRSICRFIFTDCLKSQKRYGIEAYNRIKHGLALVPSGQRYVAALPNAPAVIIKHSDRSAAEPYQLLGLPMPVAQLEQRCEAVIFVQAALRLLAALYVMRRYPTFVKDNFSLDPAPRMFDYPTMTDVKDFMLQVTADKSLI